MNASAPDDEPRSIRLAAWLRAALAPFAWLAVAVLLSSALGLALHLLLSGDGAGGWSPTWSYAEVEVSGLDDAQAEAVAGALRERHPDRVVEHEPTEGGARIVLAGDAERLDLLADLRGALAERDLAEERFGFGRDLARVGDRLLADPDAAFEAADALLPLVLLGGGVVMLVLGGWLRTRLRPRPAPPRIAPSLGAFLGLGVGVALTTGAFVLGVLLALLGWRVEEQEWIVDLFADGGPPLVAVVPMVVLVAPLAEEVFFRGYLLEALRGPWGEAAAIALSSLAFAAVHANGPALPTYVWYGVGLAVAARATRSLVVPVVAHATMNAVGVAFLVAAA